jgi:hypothetical protein
MRDGPARCESDTSQLRGYCESFAFGVRLGSMGDRQALRVEIYELLRAKLREGERADVIGSEFAGAAITLAKRHGMPKAEFLSGVDAVWDMYDFLFEGGSFSPVASEKN